MKLRLVDALRNPRTLAAALKSRPGAELEHLSGDTYRRNFTGDVAQCGCRWERVAGFGNVLRLCLIHQAATDAAVERERSRK